MTFWIGRPIATTTPASTTTTIPLLHPGARHNRWASGKWIMDNGFAPWTVQNGECTLDFGLWPGLRSTLLSQARATAGATAQAIVPATARATVALG